MRPETLHVGGVLYWTLRTRDPDTMVLKDADATPTVAVRKNGSAVGDSVTVTKRSATTGLYDCSYNPASEAEGDTFEFEERAQVTGTTTAQAYYDSGFVVRVRAVERGTDSALTTLGTNAPADWFNAASISADAGAEIAALVETYIVNEGDATAVMQAIADKIATDWVAGDASPLAIATAVWGAATRTITGGSLTTAPATAAAIADAVWDESRSGHTTDGTFGFYVDAAITSRLAPTVSGRTLNVNTSGEGEAVLDSATSTKIDSILEDTGTTLPGLIDAIPKVGSTHRYTQIAQTSTTTDVSIGEAT